ncbi:hypothetical protein J3Q64DRAFT_1861995 [Phycomyces blakesleeanus]
MVLFETESLSSITDIREGAENWSIESPLKSPSKFYYFFHSASFSYQAKTIFQVVVLDQSAMEAVDTNEIFKHNIFPRKVFLCSGGGSGIFRGMTEAMVRHGAKAVIISRSKDKLEKPAKEISEMTGGHVFAVAADVRNPA